MVQRALPGLENLVETVETKRQQSSPPAQVVVTLILDFPGSTGFLRWAEPANATPAQLKEALGKAVDGLHERRNA